MSKTSGYVTDRRFPQSWTPPPFLLLSRCHHCLLPSPFHQKCLLASSKNGDSSPLGAYRTKDFLTPDSLYLS
jgi:hypothetical protein